MKLRETGVFFCELIKGLRLQIEMIPAPRKSPLLLLILVLGVACAGAEEVFPLPPELEADVGFWVSIFTRYNTDEGVLHDNRNLAVTYEEFDIPASVSRRERNRRTGARRKHYQSVLRTLASGKRD